MNLKERYNYLVKLARDRQKENKWEYINEVIPGYDRHHVIPSCMDGEWTIDNIIVVTRKEHMHLHWLLHKIYPKNSSLCSAYCLLKFGTPPQCMPKDSEEYKTWYESNLGHDSFCNPKRPLICLETRKEYESIQEAEDDLVVCGIKPVLDGRSSSIHGYHFMDLDRYNNSTEDDIKNEMNKCYERSFRDGMSKPVLCIETETVFRTCADAEDYLAEIGKSSGHVRHVCEGYRNRTAGYHWRYLDYSEIPLEIYKESSTTRFNYRTLKAKVSGNAEPSN